MSRMARVRHDREHGAAAVEFALVFPLLIILIFGIIDFGLAMNSQIVLNNAAREGARTASLGGSYDQTIAAATAAEGTLLAPRGTPTATCVLADGVTACPTTGTTGWAHGLTSGAPSGATVTVSIPYSYKWLTPIRMVPGIPASLSFTRSSTMRVE
jgi:Flp pilus assembly protein TadG